MILIFIQSSCKKALPAETATGAKTFGCKINGQIYMPFGGHPSCGWYPVMGGGFFDGEGNNGLYIRTVSGNSKFIDIYI